MGFNWDDNRPGEVLSGDFLNETETLLLIAQGTAFFITGVAEGTSGPQYGNKPNWQFSLVLPDGSEKIKSLGKGISPRDKQAVAFREHFASDGAEPIKAKFVKMGRSIQFDQVA